MNPTTISSYLFENFEDLRIIETWGETSFFFNPNNLAPRGTYFCTIKEKDGKNDKASDLNREGVFRFNFGISKFTFLELFKIIPKRPSKGEIIEGVYDFTTLNQLIPHPVYGWMCWVSICSPSETSFTQIEPLVCESYQMIKQKHKNKEVYPKWQKLQQSQKDQ